MLIFHCTGCKGTIATENHERPSRVFDKLDKHIAECPLGTFTFEGTTDIDELARKYIETHDKKIIKELYEMARQFEEMEKPERKG